MWGETGYPTRSGGFHRTSTAEYLWVHIKFALRHPSCARYTLHRLRWRWTHRACDTTDFHHAIGCLMDPFVRQVEAQMRWQRAWTAPTGKDR